MEHDSAQNRPSGHLARERGEGEERSSEALAGARKTCIQAKKTRNTGETRRVEFSVAYLEPRSGSWSSKSKGRKLGTSLWAWEEGQESPGDWSHLLLTLTTPGDGN